MPDAAKIQQLLIEINGSVNPSTMKMIADVEKKLRDFGASTKTGPRKRRK
jgi:hypothetical protein